MKVLKFGGSSLASAEKFLNVVEIIINQPAQTRVSVVLSAPEGVTNLLVSLVENLITYDSVSESETKVQLERLRNIANVLQSEISQILIDKNIHHEKLNSSNIKRNIDNEFTRLSQLVEGAKLLGHCPNQTSAQILTLGERLSIINLTWILDCFNIKVSQIDPEKFLVAENQLGDPVSDIQTSKKKFEQHYSTLNTISLMPGFIGISPTGNIITLGRNGSDYSAAVLAVCSKAEICEIWTDVDGVYNADPRVVKDAELISKMSFNEAIELSYFGAKILHPKTILPLSSHNIPCLIKNSLAASREGTLISQQSSDDMSLKAISSLNDVSMIDVSGPGMKGKVGMTGRIFTAMSRENLPVIMISQSSAAYRISFCVNTQQAIAAQECLTTEFELEISHQLLEPISVNEGLSVVSLVGDKMQKQKGIAAKFFASLSQASVNIIAIAQDSSERSISAVIRSQRTDDAVRLCHHNLFLKRSSIDAFIIGCGTVGKELLRQIEHQQPFLLEKNIDLKVFGIANSKKLLLNGQGIQLNNNWQSKLSQSDDCFSLQRINQFVEEHHLLNPVIIDATSNESVAMSYADFLDANYHVVAANKKANTASIDYYKKLRFTAQKNKRRFLYETNVAAGLPVIDNLQHLLGAGDQLVAFEGILSGSLSYIFGQLHQGLTLSQATQKAMEKGFTEPNPAEDLSGLDVARKVLIIAREAGLNLELEDIKLQSVIPGELAEITDADEFMQKLPSLDSTIEQQIKVAEANNQVLKYVAQIHNGVCEVKIESVDSQHPLFTVQGGENALAIHTNFYQPVPFVIRGYGAGSAVTAAGLFADMLRTLVWDRE